MAEDTVVVEDKSVTVNPKTVEKKRDKTFDEQLAIVDPLFIQPPNIISKEDWDNGSRIITYTFPKVDNDSREVVQNEGESMAGVWQRILQEESQKLQQLSIASKDKEDQADRLKSRADRFLGELKVRYQQADSLLQEVQAVDSSIPNLEEIKTQIGNLSDTESMPDAWKGIYELNLLKKELRDKRLIPDLHARKV